MIAPPAPRLVTLSCSMAAQFGLRALLKRALVLHASKLVALAAFGAAMQVQYSSLACSLGLER